MKRDREGEGREWDAGIDGRDREEEGKREGCGAGERDREKGWDGEGGIGRIDGSR